jgi:antitoxin component YwqK of YwqJK toxin-antitoxin module
MSKTAEIYDGKGYIVNEEGKSRYAGWNRSGQVGFEKDEKTEVDENGLYRGYFLNGQLRYEWYFKLPLDGTRADGISRSWWPDGKLKQEVTWKDGLKHGSFNFWHENGQKWKEGTSKRDKRDGKWTYYNEDGSKKSEDIYKDGKHIKSIL